MSSDAESKGITAPQSSFEPLGDTNMVLSIQSEMSVIFLAFWNVNSQTEHFGMTHYDVLYSCSSQQYCSLQRCVDVHENDNNQVEDSPNNA